MGEPIGLIPVSMRSGGEESIRRIGYHLAYVRIKQLEDL